MISDTTYHQESQFVIMYNPDADLVTLDDLQAARKLVDASPYCRRTPLLQNVHKIFDLPPEFENSELHFKMENMQVTGDTLNGIKMYRFMCH